MISTMKRLISYFNALMKDKFERTKKCSNIQHFQQQKKVIILIIARLCNTFNYVFIKMYYITFWR